MYTIYFTDISSAMAEVTLNISSSRGNFTGNGAINDFLSVFNSNYMNQSLPFLRYYHIYEYELATYMTSNDFE